MTRMVITVALIAAAAFSRLLPHPPNFAPITALALFGAVYLDRKHSFLVPISAMLLSDYFIGFYSGMWWVYGAFVLIGLLGLWLRDHQTVGTTIGASVSGSVLFFIITNFGVWVSSQVTYPHTFAGLMECYAAAIPFFRNTLAGDIVYVGILFGTFEFAKIVVPSLRMDSQVIR